MFLLAPKELQREKGGDPPTFPEGGPSGPVLDHLAAGPEPPPLVLDQLQGSYELNSQAVRILNFFKKIIHLYM